LWPAQIILESCRGVAEEILRYPFEGWGRWADLSTFGGEFCGNLPLFAPCRDVRKCNDVLGRTTAGQRGPLLPIEGVSVRGVNSTHGQHYHHPQDYVRARFCHISAGERLEPASAAWDFRYIGSLVVKCLWYPWVLTLRAICRSCLLAPLLWRLAGPTAGLLWPLQTEILSGEELLSR